MTVLDEWRVAAEPYYAPQGDEVALFEAAYAARLPVMVKGPTGCGKSRFVEFMAFKLGRPLVTVACNEDMTAADLVGRFLLEPGGTRWQDGPLTVAARFGAICYLDEIVEARQDTTVVIHPLTDHRRTLPLDKKGELVRAHPDFQLVISYNPGYQSLMKDLKTSTRQRFAALDFDYPAPALEAQIVSHRNRPAAGHGRGAGGGGRGGAAAEGPRPGRRHQHAAAGLRRHADRPGHRAARGGAHGHGAAHHRRRRHPRDAGPRHRGRAGLSGGRVERSAMNTGGAFPAYGRRSPPAGAALPAARAPLRHAALRQRLDCRFEAVDEVFDECMDEALAVLSPAGLDAALEHARWLGKLGRGVEPLLSFLEIWPTVARHAGEAALVPLQQATQTLQKSPNGPAIAALHHSLGAVARRLHSAELLGGYLMLVVELMQRTSISIHGRHATEPSPGLPTFLQQAPVLVGLVPLDGLRRWVLEGLRLHGSHPQRQIDFFALATPDSRALLQRQRHGTLLVDVEHRLELTLRACGASRCRWCLTRCGRRMRSHWTASRSPICRPTACACPKCWTTAPAPRPCNATAPCWPTWPATGAGAGRRWPTT